MKTPMQALRNEAVEMSKKDGDAGFVGRSMIAMMDKMDCIKNEKEALEQAHMAGQADAGVDPSAYNALIYFQNL